ncbi:hypothetical protein CAI21_18715 [Alkalilimnicola ehrlichii]|uniref:Uncharacterized protein n=1 Tax=Alkalilimnicola ehrlichii TaxID=351052 RepID=A0A3E0WIT1_9GAMM|nr:hypothetical protein [Alkalilimnicola ehrlichii]RFA25561.1 hypothetical protein CAI21_18715 [Alkalilimnicola ehrlichii]RFA32688.1 hypothetical protein CAL65_18970 [Alkalilimnicola ehrlichii]
MRCRPNHQEDGYQQQHRHLDVIERFRQFIGRDADLMGMSFAEIMVIGMHGKRGIAVDYRVPVQRVAK